jgi:hypothetical protein
MKKWVALGLFGWAATVFAAETFSRRLTADEFRRAGLDKLSPAELAVLDSVFKKYTAPGGDAVAVAAPVPAPPPRAEIEAAVAQESAARIAAAEARTRRAEQEAAAARQAAEVAKAEQKKAEESFLTKARKAIVPAGTKVEVAAIETEIDGDFIGWDGSTVWRMKDGTQWRVDNRPPPYYAKRMKNPKVRISAAALSGFWLEVVELDLKVRVSQIR